MNPEAIINEMFARQKQLLQEAEAIRQQRRLAADDPDLGQTVSQLLGKAGRYLKTQFRNRLTTPIFGRH